MFERQESPFSDFPSEANSNGPTRSRGLEERLAARLSQSSAKISDLAGNCSKALRTMGSGSYSGSSEEPDEADFGRQTWAAQRLSQPATEPKVVEKRIFVDAAAMKEKVRQNLTKPRYAVTDYYKTVGCWQFIARNAIFENTTLGVIAFNAIWIAVDTDFNHEEMLLDAHPVFQIAENMFCAYFSFEWLVRFMSFRRKRDGLKDAWFVFDSLLVTSMVLETWVLTLVALTSSSGSGGGVGNASILRIARLLRLSRMARMARLLRAMPELMVLIKGMMAATRSVFFTLCLLVLIIYVFAIAFTQLCSETEIGDQYFKAVPDSMYTLLVYGALLDDIGTISAELGAHSIFFAAVFFLFSLLAALTVMNMLIGVLCEVVSAVAATEKEEMLVSYVNEKLRQVVSLLDTDGDKQISKKEFVEILENAEAARALQEVGVDVVGLIDFADFIFEDDNVNEGQGDEKELSFGDFMEVVLQLRGSNSATVKDIVDLRKFIRRALIQMNTQLSNTQKAVVRTTMHMAELGAMHATRSDFSSAGRAELGSPKLPIGRSNTWDQSPDQLQRGESRARLVARANSCESVDNKIPASDAKVKEIFSFVVEENGDSPKAPLLTPGASLLQCRAYDNQHLFSAESAQAPPHHGDLVALTGQWRPLEHDTAKESNGTSTFAPCGNDSLWSDCSLAPVFIEMEELRGRMAHIGKFLATGLEEFHKLQEGLLREIPTTGNSNAAVLAQLEKPGAHCDNVKKEGCPKKEGGT